MREIDAVLPPSFLDGAKSSSAFAGGVELAFSSTTLDPGVAVDYSGGALTTGSLFVIDFDLTSRAASVKWLSQYPNEEELIFPPCTGLSCRGHSTRGKKRLILLRPTVSTAKPNTADVDDTKYVPGTVRVPPRSHPPVHPHTHQHTHTTLYVPTSYPSNTHTHTHTHTPPCMSPPHIPQPTHPHPHPPTLMAGGGD